jgi:hypothetical protein
MQRRSFIVSILAGLAAPFRSSLFAGDGRLHSFDPPAAPASSTVAYSATSARWTDPPNASSPRLLISSELARPSWNAVPYEPIYNISGNWNPTNGQIARHLYFSHGINAAGMSRTQMLSAHDQAHLSRLMPPAAFAGGGGCPGGVCLSPLRRFP